MVIYQRVGTVSPRDPKTHVSLLFVVNVDKSEYKGLSKSSCYTGIQKQSHVIHLPRRTVGLSQFSSTVDGSLVTLQRVFSTYSIKSEGT